VVGERQHEVERPRRADGDRRAADDLDRPVTGPQLGLFARSLDAGSYHVLSTSLTTVAPFGLISQLAALSGLRSCRFKGDTAAAFIAHLRGLPKRTVLFIDEAHLLPDASLEDLRLLTAGDFDRRSPFALVLVGQPLLRERLNEL
jgi:hypothetical protein